MRRLPTKLGFYVSLVSINVLAGAYNYEMYSRALKRKKEITPFYWY